jgi:hypothetical protein
MSGYIKLYKKFKNWAFYKDHNTKILFIHLLLIANYKENKWQKITIKPGQILTSVNTLSNETGLSVQQIRTSLKKLKDNNEITSKATNKNTLVTLCNWAFYQNCEQQATNKVTNEQQAKQQTKTLTSNKQNNNITIIKSDNYNNNNVISNKQNEQQATSKLTTLKEIKEIKEKINKKEIIQDLRPVDALPFDSVTALKSLQTLDQNFIIENIENLHGLKITANEINEAAKSFAFVGVANYDKYRFIRDPQQLINLFFEWVPKNLKYQKNNKSKKDEASPEEISEYLKKLYGKNYFIKCLDGEKYLKRFSEYKPQIKTELKKYDNKNLDIKLMFLILITPLGNAVTKNPRFMRRAAAFEYWYKKQSDYNQKHGDLLKLLRKELNKNN